MEVVEEVELMAEANELQANGWRDISKTYGHW